MRHRNGLTMALDQLFCELHESHENYDYNFSTNGEASLLRKLAETSRPFRMVFDVGANNGDWSLLASRLLPAAHIHAFELVPETYQQLAAACADHPRVSCHNLGLSDSTGEIDVFVPGGGSTLATCVAGFAEQYHGHKPRTARAHVTTGDAFCEESGVNSIDFLKLDVEGFEDRVLQGFGRMLEQRRIRVIQFEYGRINIDTHFLLKDFHNFLEAAGMRVGKLYRDGVEFRKYRHRDENFLGPNYVAVLDNEEELISLMRGAKGR